jgi:CHASE1-domain containing sensor protein
MAPAVTREEFRMFTQVPLQRHLESLALSWVPVVPGSERELYEERARRDGFTDLEVEEKTPGGTLVSASDSGSVLSRVLPRAAHGGRPPLGFDIGADRPQRETLERARDTGATTATTAASRRARKEQGKSPSSCWRRYIRRACLRRRLRSDARA